MNKTAEILPRLVEPYAQFYLMNTLQKCHDYRTKIYSIILNVSVFILFIGSVSLVLYVCYKRQITPDEKHKRMIKDQEYILSKIRFYQNEREKKMSSRITELPTIQK